MVINHFAVYLHFGVLAQAPQTDGPSTDPNPNLVPCSLQPPLRPRPHAGGLGMPLHGDNPEELDRLP